MNIKIHNLEFSPFLDEVKILTEVKHLGRQITKDFKGEQLLVIGVLNGASIFMADLCRAIDLPLATSFVRVKSYERTESTGKIQSILGLEDELEGKSVLIVEDIVDTGITMKYLISEISNLNPAKISIATLLFKPDAFQFNYPLDYVGFEIPNKFVVGYGLDYDGLGRNLPAIYQLLAT
jgi:hypoxanthine phosphoribosyltransferase